MDSLTLIRLVVGALLFVGFGISGFHRRRAAAADPSARRGDEPTRMKALRAALALPGFGVLLGSVVVPSWFGWASFEAPVALRVVGVALMLIGVVLAAWLFPHLGRNVTATTLVKDSHELVTTGPYRWVRHPLYLAGTLMLGGAGLALGSWVILAFIGAFFATWSTIVIPREEESLEARFGEPYRAYRARTGALLPKL